MKKLFFYYHSVYNNVKWLYLCTANRKCDLLCRQIPRSQNIQWRALSQRQHDLRTQDLSFRNHPEVPTRKREEGFGRGNRSRPFSRNKIIDLSYAAAKQLDILHKGVNTVELREWVWDMSRFMPFVFDFRSISINVPPPTGKCLKMRTKSAE